MSDDPNLDIAVGIVQQSDARPIADRHRTDAAISRVQSKLHTTLAEATALVERARAVIAETPAPVEPVAESKAPPPAVAPAKKAKKKVKAAPPKKKKAGKKR